MSDAEAPTPPDEIRRILDLVVADDFLQVRPALVRVLDGNGNAAIAFTLIQRRTTGQWGPHYERAGRNWWRATLEDLMRESGLKKDPLRSALKMLTERGLVIAERHLQDGIWDRPNSYRLVTTEDLPDPVGLSPHAVGQSPHANGTEPTSHVGLSPLLPLKRQGDNFTLHTEAVDNSEKLQTRDHASRHTDSVGEDEIGIGKPFTLTPKRKALLHDVLTDCGLSYAIPQWDRYIRTVDWPTGKELLRQWAGIREAVRNGEKNRRADVNRLLEQAGVPRLVSDADWQTFLAAVSGPNATVRIEF